MGKCINDIFNIVRYSSFIDDLKKCVHQRPGWKTAALRAREATFELERHLKRFRVLSCAEEQKTINYGK